jgi:hypothetical protein
MILRKVATILLALSISLSVSACIGINTKEMFAGKTAHKDDRIRITQNATVSGTWSTNELSVHYTYTSTNDSLGITGYISISKHITNAYSKVRFMYLRLSFLDKNGKVTGTEHINPAYFANSTPPEKIRFDSNLSLPAGTHAFCFSYSGELVGDDAVWDSVHIGKTQFIDNY